MHANPVPRSGVVAFRPRARLLKLIGSELISDDVLAITELVKNAHDADASTAVVEFRGVSSPDGEIVVRDDGVGMDLDTLLGRWMQPAASSKLHPASRFTPRGRRVLGEKGVGRFAADKLGHRLELISKRERENQEVVATFDWDDFDDDLLLLSEVKSRWGLRPATVLQTRGTVLRISRPRSLWNERMFRRLSTRLSRLRSPFRQFDGFTIRIDSDEFPQYSGELRADFLDRAPYRIDARFDGDRTLDINVNGAKSIKQLSNGISDLRCGPVKMHIFGFDLETDAMARVGPRIDVRAWLREWSGISVYRDGFRVWPYGEPHDDWLRLDQRRVNNPVVRLSNNQIVGFVEISRDGNPELVDQTNREGLIHNGAYEDLRRLLYFVLEILEGDRKRLRHPAARVPTGIVSVAHQEDSVSAALERFAAKVDNRRRSELLRLASRAREASTRHEEMYKRVLDGYLDLAALGQAAIGLSRCVQPHLDRLRTLTATIRRGTAGAGRKDMLTTLDAVEMCTNTIATRVAMVGPTEARINYRRGKLDVEFELRTFRSLAVPALQSEGVEMEIAAPDKDVIRINMRPETFHRLLNILTTNSLQRLRAVRRPRIRISAQRLVEKCEILFSDNGPGIPSAVANCMFEPVFSSKGEGGGLGLTIAHSIVKAHCGEIRALLDGRRRGAHMQIMLPGTRSRATLQSR